MSEPAFTPKPMQSPFGIINYLTPPVSLRQFIPSAVDRLAALGDPAGETAKRVEEWDEREAQMRDLIAESVRRTLDPLVGKPVREVLEMLDP